MFRWREQDIKQEKKIWTWVFFSGCKLCNILMQQQTKKFLTTNATTCPTSKNYCVTSELLLVLFKKVRDSFIKETRKLVYNWFGPKSTSHNWFLLFDPISEIFLSSSLKKISVQSSFGHLNYFHLIDWWPKTKYQLSDDFFLLSFQFKKKRGQVVLLSNWNF